MYLCKHNNIAIYVCVYFCGDAHPLLFPCMQHAVRHIRCPSLRSRAAVTLHLLQVDGCTYGCPTFSLLSIRGTGRPCRAANKRFAGDEGFKARSREAVTKLQSGDEESLRAWGRICEASRRAYAALYDRLGVKLEVRLGCSQSACSIRCVVIYNRSAHCMADHHPNNNTLPTIIAAHNPVT